MLTVEDIQRLFTHCREVHQNCPTDKIPKLTTGLAKMWIKAFDGYSYQQVEAAIDDRAAENRFWPQAAEVKPYLPLPCGRTERTGLVLSPFWLELLKRNRERKARARAAGLPTYEEAAAQGMSLMEWCNLLDESGFSFEAILEELPC